MCSDQTRRLRVACVQLRSGVSPGANIAEATRWIRAAAGDGAGLIATPEMTNLLDMRGQTEVFDEADDPALAAFSALAAELRVWLLIGSLAVLAPDGRKANRSVLLAPSGAVFARYDKIHMFDVEIGDGQTYRESARYRPGEAAVLAQTALAAIGLTICYDVRFPALYRALAQAGAEIIAVPAAFTQLTGAAHWHTLLRARAIETGAFVIAPAQGGRHEDGRETFGHSLIVSPWGDVLTQADGDAPGVVWADLDLGEVASARARIPAVTADRAFTLRVETGRN